MRRWGGMLPSPRFLEKRGKTKDDGELDPIERILNEDTMNPSPTWNLNENENGNERIESNSDFNFYLTGFLTRQQIQPFGRRASPAQNFSNGSSRLAHFNLDGS